MTKFELTQKLNTLATENAALRAEISRLKTDNDVLRAKLPADHAAESKRRAMEMAKAEAMRCGRVVRV